MRNLFQTPPKLGNGFGSKVKKVIAGALCAAMSLSMFAGTGLTAKAEEMVTLYFRDSDTEMTNLIAPVRSSIGMANIPNSIPVKEGYKFLGWANEDSYIKGLAVAYDNRKYPGENITVYQDDVYYALWRNENFTVVYDTDGGTEVSSQVVKYNDNDIAQFDFPSIIPIKEGYTFLGWSENPNNPSKNIINPGFKNFWIEYNPWWGIFQGQVSDDANKIIFHAVWEESTSDENSRLPINKVLVAGKDEKPSQKLNFLMKSHPAKQQRQQLTAHVPILCLGFPRKP